MVLFLTTLRKEIFSKKSIFISIFYILSAYIIGYYSPILANLFNKNDNLGVIDILLTVYTLLGYLFSSVLFSSLLSKDIESRSMRFLSPYISRNRIYLAKYLASTCYFWILITISSTVLFIVGDSIKLSVYSLLFIFGFCLYCQSLVMIVSVLVNGDRISSLLNLMLSLLFPICYGLSLLKNWPILKLIQWLFPYHYLGKTWEISILYLLSIILVFVGQQIFKKKEL